MNAKKVVSGTIVPSGEAGQFLSRLEFLGELSQGEQRAVVSGTDNLFRLEAGFQKLRIEAAETIVELRKVLKSKGKWLDYCKHLPFSSRSYDRWGDRFEQLALPPAVVTVAKERGIDPIHYSYLEPILEHRPPKDPDHAQAVKWWDGVEKRRGTALEARRDGTAPMPAPDALKDAYKAVARRYRAVRRDRGGWMLKLAGYLLALAELPSQKVVADTAPADFDLQKAGRRPKVT